MSTQRLCQRCRSSLPIILTICWPLCLCRWGSNRSLNLGFTEWSCEAIFDNADRDKNGSIDYPEFLQGFRAGVDAFGKDQGVMFVALFRHINVLIVGVLPGWC